MKEDSGRKHEVEEEIGTERRLAMEENYLKSEHLKPSRAK